MDINLNVKHKIIKLLENNIGEHLGNLGCGDDFLDITPKVWSMKEIIDNLSLIKIKNFCSMEDNAKRMRSQTIDREKISSKDISHKGLLSKIYKNLNT